MVQAYLLSARQPNADVAALAFVRGDLNFDLAEHLPQLKTPTIILWGEKAQFTDVDTGRRLAALNSEAILKFETPARCWADTPSRATKRNHWSASAFLTRHQQFRQ